MALIKCSDCGKDISSDAIFCFNCGKTQDKITEGIKLRNSFISVTLTFFKIFVTIVGFMIIMASVVFHTFGGVLIGLLLIIYIFIYTKKLKQPFK